MTLHPPVARPIILIKYLRQSSNDYQGVEYKAPFLIDTRSSQPQCHSLSPLLKKASWAHRCDLMQRQHAVLERLQPQRYGRLTAELHY